MDHRTEDKREPDLPPSEVRALCTLLARILYRSLAQQDPRAVALLSLPVASPVPPADQETGNHAV